MRQQVNVSDLEIGMYVAELDQPRQGIRFPAGGFQISSDKHIEVLNKHCEYVYIDILRSEIHNTGNYSTISVDTGNFSAGNQANRGGGSDMAKIPSKDDIRLDQPPPPPAVPFQEEIETAKNVHAKLETVVDDLFHCAEHDEHLNVEQAKTVVQEVVNSINRNEYALGWMSQLKNKDNYTAIHSMNVCILSVKLGRQVGLDQEQLNQIGMCGLMHDIGKLKVPNEILNKPGKLTDREMEIMKTHVTEGERLLRDTKGTPMNVCNTALSHHEKLDGSGYPDNLKGEQIDLYTRMVAIADIYDAVTSDRIYHAGMTTNSASSMLYKMGGQHLDRELVQAFIACIGLYPEGTLVETVNGEVGLVVSSNYKHRLNPSVLMILDNNKQRYKRARIIDTSKYRDESGKYRYNIRNSLNTGSFGLHPRDFFD